MADFKFPGNKEKLRSKYWTYRNYLIARCESLPDQIERKFKNCECNHTESSAFGMSNYIEIEKKDQNGDYLDSITIRVSDHDPTGSGEHCEHYLYIHGCTWMEIKKEILEIVKNFLR